MRKCAEKNVQSASIMISIFEQWANNIINPDVRFSWTHTWRHKVNESSFSSFSKVKENDHDLET